jgi:hypothetical protein
MMYDDTDRPATAPAVPPTPSTPALSGVVVPLLRGVLYREESPELWDALLELQSQVRDYVAVLGLLLILDEAEGYAYLRSRPEEDDDGAPGIPRLIARRPLSFPVSLLLALLLKMLAVFDAGAGETRLVLSRGEVVELMRVFLPEGSNEARLIDQVDTHLNRVVELGFLRRLKTAAGQEAAFEVRRILKAFVDAEWLARLDARLAEEAAARRAEDRVESRAESTPEPARHAAGESMQYQEEG